MKNPTKLKSKCNSDAAGCWKFACTVKNTPTFETMKKD